MVICNHVNIKKPFHDKKRFHDNVYNLYSLWLNSKLIIVVIIIVVFNRDFYLKKTVKYIQECIAKL